MAAAAHEPELVALLVKLGADVTDEAGDSDERPRRQRFDRRTGRTAVIIELLDSHGATR